MDEPDNRAASTAVRLKDAIDAFADPAELALFNELGLRAFAAPDSPDALTDAERWQLINWSANRHNTLIGRLQSGELVAFGWWPGAKASEEIPSDWWQPRTELDPASDAAQTDGRWITRIRIARAIPPAELIVDPATLPLRLMPAHDLDAAKTWMQQNVIRPGQWKRDTAVQQCSREAGVTARVARTAWKALDDDLRGSRGRHK